MQIPLDQITILDGQNREKSVLTDIDKVGKWQRANRETHRHRIFTDGT